MVPEDLTTEGYTVKWKAGTPGVPEGWGDEQVVDTKGSETIHLRSGNAMEPWSTIRRMDVPVEMSRANRLGQLLVERIIPVVLEVSRV
jgi:hypothetical protein